MKLPRPTGTRAQLNGTPSTVRELAREELLEMIDARSRALLGVSGKEFIRLYEEGRLEYSPAEAPVIVLADLLAAS